MRKRQRKINKEIFKSVVKSWGIPEDMYIGVSGVKNILGSSCYQFAVLGESVDSFLSTLKQELKIVFRITN